MDPAGRVGTAVAYTHNGRRDMLIFDPKTTELLGERTIIVDAADASPPGILGLTGPEPDESPISISGYPPRLLSASSLHRKSAGCRQRQLHRVTDGTMSRSSGSKPVRRRDGGRWRGVMVMAPSPLVRRAAGM